MPRVLVGQAQVQREHVAGLEQRLAALGRVVAVGDRALARLASLPQTMTCMPNARP